MNYRRNAEVRALVAKFQETYPDVDLDHLPMLHAAVNYGAVLGFALARTWPEGIEAWAIGSSARGRMDT